MTSLYIYNSIDVKQEYISNSLIIEWGNLQNQPMCISVTICGCVRQRMSLFPFRSFGCPLNLSPLNSSSFSKLCTIVVYNHDLSLQSYIPIAKSQKKPANTNPQPINRAKEPSNPIYIQTGKRANVAPSKSSKSKVLVERHVHVAH